MSDRIPDAQNRKKILKHMILQLHSGEAPEEVKNRLALWLQKIPYQDVVEVEQELMAEGLPQEEVLRLCDVHARVLEGKIDRTGTPAVGPGHPVEILKRENSALEKVVERLQELYSRSGSVKTPEQARILVSGMAELFNSLAQVALHYAKKENLVFPYLEKQGITGPPKVMWSKHDETRRMLKAAQQVLGVSGTISSGDLEAMVETVLKPASQSILEMILKEEEIFFPMCLDKITEKDWREIGRQMPEIGFCLIEAGADRKPAEEPGEIQDAGILDGTLTLPTGTLNAAELTSLLNTVPFDITFVDSDDKVRYFSQGKERIFARNRSILGRDVRLCHPTSSVHVVEKILADFKSGKRDSAPFWIKLGKKFIHIEYFALRDGKGRYLGTLEVSQDLTLKKSLKGEQRLLSYES
ncbi:DUF438 domain-containing protein [bacterium]|nr:DUF438 domain-containing protein [bacterium]